MTQRTARLRKQVRSTKPEPPPVVWPPSFRVSERGFEMLCRANRDLRLERDANGKVQIMSPAGMRGSRKNGELFARLWLWNEQSGLGVPFESSGGVTLPNTAIRAADVTWIAIDRWNALTEEEQEKFAHIVPDFVVELRSPTDAWKKLRRKMEEYVSQGIRLGWLIDPKSREVEISRPGRPVELLKNPATLSGEDVLPGFVLDIQRIWSV